MIVFYLTLPLMLVAIGIAVLPLLWVTKLQGESETQIAASRSEHQSISGGPPPTVRVADADIAA